MAVRASTAAEIEATRPGLRARRLRESLEADEEPRDDEPVVAMAC